MGQVDKWLDRIILGIGLTIVLAAGITIGNVSSNAITAHFAAQAFQKETAKMAAEAEARTRKLAIESEKKRRELARQAAARQKHNEELQKQREQEAKAQAQLNSTCSYWISEYNKSRNAYDKAQRDVACRAAGRPFN